MTTTKQNWLLVGLVLIGGIALWLMSAPNQGAKWESYITAAQQAYQQADYAEAEKRLEAAHFGRGRAAQHTARSPAGFRFRPARSLPVFLTL